MTWQRTLQLAGIGFELHVDGYADGVLEGKFGRFAAAIEPSARLDIRCGPEFVSIEQPADAHYPACSVHAEGPDVLLYQRLGFRMRWDRKTGRATVEAGHVAGRLPEVDDRTNVDTALRLLLSLLLAEREGMVLHATGYADSRGAIVFPGASGAGKSTTAAKLPIDRVLSDDQVAIRRLDGVWHAFALPLVGEYGKQPRPQHGRLARILLLKKAADGATVRRISPALAAVRLLECATWFAPGDPGAGRLLELATDLAERQLVGAVELGLSASPLTLIDELLS